MTDPETKVLAFQIDGKIRLVWEKEEEPMWLDFEPLTYFGGPVSEFKTQIVTIPQDCTLYMDCTQLKLNYTGYNWIKNSEPIVAWAGSAWMNRSLGFVQGDQLSIRGVMMRGSGQSGTLTLYLNNAGGDKVAEFDFMYP